MRYLPIFLDVRGKRVLVLGSGEVAARKAEALRRAGADIAFADRFDPALLDDCVLAIGADAPEPDLVALSAAARARSLPVNVVDKPALCSFITPAVVDRDPLIVAVGSAGEAPVLARLVRARIEALLPPSLARLAAIAGSFSGELRELFPAPSVRRRVLERMLSGRPADLVLAGDEAGGIAAMRREIAGASGTPPGVVALVFAGPGAADLVTMRAHRLLGEADVVVHDATVSAAVLDLARRDADFVAVDNDGIGLVIDLAREGKRVVRLGNFDDADRLRTLVAEAVITVEVVPGVAYSGALPRTPPEDGRPLDTLVGR